MPQVLAADQPVVPIAVLPVEHLDLLIDLLNLRPR
jgi:hypothetical protein